MSLAATSIEPFKTETGETMYKVIIKYSRYWFWDSCETQDFGSMNDAEKFLLQKLTNNQHTVKERLVSDETDFLERPSYLEVLKDPPVSTKKQQKRTKNKRRKKK